MSEYTPGPWLWHWHEQDGKANCGVHHLARPGQAYSVCRAPKYQSKEQWEADARLIAAAPDLLEALEYMLETCPGIDHVGDEARKQAFEAVKKARGEQ